MPIPTNTNHFERSLAREEVYKTLRGWIVEGELKAGEILRDQDLGTALGVSRTPVREALRRLEDEGMVETALNRWTRVTSLDLDEACRIYPVIWTLESLALNQAEKNLGPNELEQMEAINQELNQALEKGSGSEVARTDAAFHQVFINCSNNPELIKILDVLKAKIQRLEKAYFSNNELARESVEEHAAILTALNHNDFIKAAEAIKANWEGSLKRILAGKQQILE